MEQILDLLNQFNNEGELFEELLEAILEGKDGNMIAAKIQAGRDVRFDLQKVILENDKLRVHDKKTVADETKGQIQT